MLIRILEPNAYFKKGLIRVSNEVARDLISKGIAVRIHEDALDNKTHDHLDEAKARDIQQGSDSR